MSRKIFIEELIDLLVMMDKGQLELEEPMPAPVQDHIMSAIVALGDEAVPTLHQKLSEQKLELGFGYLIDALGKIKNNLSDEYIIDFHKNYANFMSGAAAVSALKHLGTEKAYIYLSECLVSYSQGEINVFNSNVEIVIACQALGSWGDLRAMEALKRSITIQKVEGMPDTAIKILARYPAAHDFLVDVADKEPALKRLIDDLLQDP